MYLLYIFYLHTVLEYTFSAIDRMSYLGIYSPVILNAI